MSCGSVVPISSPTVWVFRVVIEAVAHDPCQATHSGSRCLARDERGPTYFACHGSVGGVMGTNMVTVVGSVVSNGRARQIIDDPLITLTLAAPEPGIDDRIVFMATTPPGGLWRSSPWTSQSTCS